MTKVAKLVDARPVHQDVVALLRNALERAERGEIEAIVLAAQSVERCIATAYAGEPDVYRLVGAIESLKRRIMDNEDA